MRLLCVELSSSSWMCSKEGNCWITQNPGVQPPRGCAGVLAMAATRFHTVPLRCLPTLATVHLFNHSRGYEILTPP